MTAPAIIMMTISILILWGGLIGSIVALSRARSFEPGDPTEQLAHRDL